MMAPDTAVDTDQSKPVERRYQYEGRYVIDLVGERAQKKQQAREGAIGNFNRDAEASSQPMSLEYLPRDAGNDYDFYTLLLTIGHDHDIRDAMIDNRSGHESTNQSKVQLAEGARRFSGTVLDRKLVGINGRSIQGLDAEQLAEFLQKQI